MDSKIGQFHQLISWKHPPSATAYSVLPQECKEDGALLVCDENRLGGFLFSVYTQMFANEDFIDAFANMSLTSILKSNLIYYIRASFSEFISFVSRRVQVDWVKKISHFIDLVESDSKLVFLSSYQDLICQLYLSNRYVADTLRWRFLEVVRNEGDCFKGWRAVPPVVSVTLKVPR